MSAGRARPGRGCTSDSIIQSSLDLGAAAAGIAPVERFGRQRRDPQ